MSNLANIAIVQNTIDSQLPVNAYFDEQLYQIEQARLFAQGPRYIGHELMVPEVGDYHVLEADNDARYLKRSEGGISLLSNICRHRQALMLEGRGNQAHTICPIHRWTYDDQGQLLGAPHFKKIPVCIYPIRHYKLGMACYLKLGAILKVI